jgi:hypothetical protein
MSLCIVRGKAEAQSLLRAKSRVVKSLDVVQVVGVGELWPENSCLMLPQLGA